MLKTRSKEGKHVFIYDDTIEMLDDITFLKIINESIEAKNSKVYCIYQSLDNRVLYISIIHTNHRILSFHYDIHFRLNTNTIHMTISKYKYPKEVDNK